MRITDLTKVNASVRRWRKNVTMLENLNKRMDYHNKNSATKLNFSHIARYREINALLNDQLTRLDRDELISHPQLGRLLGSSVTSVMDYVFKGLPAPVAAQHDEITAELVKLMNNKGRDQKAAQHKFNLAAEIAYRTSQGWYLVFNTLTVRPGAYYAVFQQNSYEFKNYIRTIQREIDQAETGSRNHKTGNKQPNGTNHTYFACIEEGSKLGRLHIHVLHFVRTLPVSSHDPNRGRTRPILREIADWKHHWKHGHSLPLAVRYSPKDAYGQAGWRWPFDLKTNNSLQIRSPLALASYMSKYITKSYTSCKRAELLWRVRKSHKLGTAILTELTSLLTPEALLLLATTDTIKLTLNNNRIPPHLLREKSLQRLQSLPSIKNICGYDTITQLAKSVTPRPSLLQSLKDSTTKTLNTSQQKITTSSIREWLPEDTFNQAWAVIKQAAQTIDDKYYRRSLMPYGTTSTADYLIST